MGLTRTSTSIDRAAKASALNTARSTILAQTNGWQVAQHRFQHANWEGMFLSAGLRRNNNPFAVSAATAVAHLPVLILSCYQADFTT